MKKPVVLEKLVKALALQVGSEVSFTELAQTIGANKLTVEKYIDLLEKAFIVFVVPAYSRNVRNEIKKGRKVYFYDCGIRNAIIDVFAPAASRTDTGALWENYLMAERRKMLYYAGRDVKQYFWRSSQQQEIDLIEEEGQQLRAYEFKWSKTAKVRFPQTFTEHYEVAETGVISKENMDEFLTGSRVE
jgi:predicted AAA+ superfamily ATPase